MTVSPPGRQSPGRSWRWPRRWRHLWRRPQLRIELRLDRRQAAGLAAGLVLLDVLGAFLLSLPLDKVQHASPVVVDRQGVWLRAVPTDGGRWRLRADLERTDRQFIRRLVAMEDSRFWWHPGVDPMAILRAAATDLSAGRIRSGGSTLTMQLARRLDPNPRSLRFKLLEAIRAIGLQWRLGKSGVLADYLTLAPYGGNLEGVRAASLATAALRAA